MALNRPPTRVGILPISGFALMSYACTVEPLRAANLLAGRRLYEVVHFGDAPLIESSGAALINTALDPSSVVSGFQAGPSQKTGQGNGGGPGQGNGGGPGEGNGGGPGEGNGGRWEERTKGGNLDLMLVIAGGDPFAVDNRALFAWLKRLDRAGVRLGGVSGGPVILAKAGLLAGRRMTVHWEHASLLAERFPDCLIERRLYVIDRDRVTCGGGMAPLDLMHAVIARDQGSAFARLVSDWFLHTHIRAATAPQRHENEPAIGPQSPLIAEAISVMESHIGDPLSLAQLALISGVTPRHLNRLFMAALGTSTMAYYRAMRLAVAKRLVTTSAMALSEIAETTGFSNASHFSNAYKMLYRVRPQADRQRDLV